MSKSAAPLGCLIVTVSLVVGVPLAWRFLKASWPTWGFLILALGLLAAVKPKKENLFFKATQKVLKPIAVGLGILMGLEFLFALFKSFINDEHVAAIEDAILKVHFAVEHLEKRLGYVIPLCVAIAVAFLCLTVGNWKYSAALSKLKNAFSFVSVLLLVMSSFTFFGHDATATFLDWEKEKNQGLYKMALAGEERSVARLVAVRELYKPLIQPDLDTKKSFETFFVRMKMICMRVSCFRERNEVDLDLFGKTSVWAFRETIHEKVKEDYIQFVPKEPPATEEKKTPVDIFSPDYVLHVPAKGGLPYWELPIRIDDNLPANIDLASSKSPQERLLSRRVSSQKEREEQKQAVQQQQNRAHDMAGRERRAKEKLTEAFAAVLAAAVPDADGIIGAYVRELVDAAAERVVRPLVDRMFQQGYRPASLDDLHFAIEALPPRMSETFDRFHSVGTRSSEESEMARPDFVESYFNGRQEALTKQKAEFARAMEEIRKEIEEEKGE
jgi:hypothetical protein